MIAPSSRTGRYARPLAGCWLTAGLLAVVMIQYAWANPVNPGYCCSDSNACEGCKLASDAPGGGPW